jgi:polyisoprenoid-binding protein YceI
MKKTIFIFAFAALSLIVNQTAQAQNLSVNAEESTIHWLGKKVTGEHEGDISLKSGNLVMTEGNLTGGQFVVDMTSITCTDLEGKSANNLVGHLKSDDFFGVETYPEAKLIFTTIENKGGGIFGITGDFNIKGQTHAASFDLNISEGSATAKVIIDRSKYGVRYGSNSFFDNLGNKAIDDNFELTVNLKL